MPTPFRPDRHALARLHRMASLEAGGMQLIEPLLQELRRVVGFDFGCMLYPGSDGELMNYAQEPMQSVARDYFDARILRSERQVLVRSPRDFGEVVRHEHGPRLMREQMAVPLTELLRSDYYDAVMRPTGAKDYMSLVLRTAQGVGLAVIHLFRDASAPDFTPQDAALLARLEAHLARALQQGERDAQGSEVHSQGVLVATPQGRLMWISPEAEALMPLAFGWGWRRGAQLPPALQELLRRLNAQQPVEMSLPAMELFTAQGWFSLRATHLTPAPQERQDRQAVALHITRRVAHGVRLLSALQTLGLPQRQHELAWWLARGLPESQIAQRMGISLNTAVYHRRQLYNRLGVMGRDELLAQIGRKT
ncbi:helix-turn-helix transcriptional regulator [Acidovorax sp. LjRoot66]|uniref:helix-turn-helix transcriptional regulator n=1 Tax=Acidovorax sp. LjRoot66 TaxID=3342334 RepID=UPI003ECCBD67